MATDLDELISLDASGALGVEEQRALKARLAAAPAEVRAAAAMAYELAAEVAAATAGPREPGVGFRERLMHVVRKPGTHTRRAGEGAWLTPMRGIEMKVLSLDRGRDSATLLMKVAPGTTYPAHHHQGPEECYVISGEVTIHGQVLKAGDFHHAEPGSDHEEMISIPGCEVLLVVTASDYRL